MSIPKGVTLEEHRTWLKANDFLKSPRGQYIMAQALYHAIKTMKAVPEKYRESSNIADMEYLQENLFTFPPDIFEAADPQTTETLGKLLGGALASPEKFKEYLDKTWGKRRN